MVSTKAVAFTTISYRGVAAFVPDSLEQQKGCERRAIAVVPVCASSVWCRVGCWFALFVLLAADC